MDKMRLKMNEEKTEFILFGNQVRLNKVKCNQLIVSDKTVTSSNLVKCLGAWLDKNLSFKDHSTKKAQIAMLNYQQIRNIRQFLTRDACETLVLSLVISHLDYCNGMLLGCSYIVIDKLQRIQSISAKLVLLKGKHTSTTEALKELNWLPIRARIEFKVLTIIHKALFGIAPNYIKKPLCIIT